MGEDYYILTLAAIARELSREHITQANVFLAAGLPLSWVAKQRKAFQAYLLQNREVELSFRRKDYHIRIVGASGKRSPAFSGFPNDRLSPTG